MCKRRPPCDCLAPTAHLFRLFRLFRAFYPRQTGQQKTHRVSIAASPGCSYGRAHALLVSYAPSAFGPQGGDGATARHQPRHARSPQKRRSPDAHFRPADREIRGAESPPLDRDSPAKLTDYASRTLPRQQDNAILQVKWTDRLPSQLALYTVSDKQKRSPGDVRGVPGRGNSTREVEQQ